MPSVTMIDGMRPAVTSTPLIAPQRAPTATPASRGRIRPPVLKATAPAATAHRPIIEPVEMSISPHSMTWLTASAMIPSTATEIPMDSKLDPLRNLSLLSEKATTSTARNTRAGASGRTINLRKASPEEVPRCSAGARASVIAHTLSRVIGSRAISSSGGRGHHVLLRGFFSLELTGDAALSHDHDPVGHREDFFQLRGNEEAGFTLHGEVVYEAVDLRLCSHVDTSCRLIEEQDGRLAGQRFRQDHLLLVATRETADRLGHLGPPNREVLGEPVGCLPLRPGHEPEPGDPVQDAQRNVVLYGERQDEPLRTPLLGHVEYAALHSRLGRVYPNVLAVDPYLSVLRRMDAKDALGHFAPAGPDESGQPHDLTPAHGEVYVFELTGSAQATYLEGYLAGAVRAPGEQLV